MYNEAEHVVSHVGNAMGVIVGATMLGIANSRATQAQHLAAVARNQAACTSARAAVRARYAVRERAGLEEDLLDALDAADHLRIQLRKLTGQVAQLQADNGTLARAVLHYRNAAVRQAA